MKRLAITAVLVISLFYLLIPASARASAVEVFVSIAPEKYFVEKIGGDLVNVQVMVPPGSNPHNYEPKPRQMVELSRSAAYFAIGITFEDIWLARIAAANPDMKIFHAEKGIKKIPMARHHHHDAEEKDDHDEADHDEGRLDPHVWTSAVNVKVMAENMMKGLIEIDPANRAAYKAGCDRFLDELDGLDKDLRDILKDKAGLKFMVFHPAWGYFARDYNLRQVPVEIEGKEPKPAQVKELIEHAVEEGIRVVFVQPQISTKSAEMIARAIGGRVVPIDPLAEDWGKNLHFVADEFKKALK